MGIRHGAVEGLALMSNSNTIPAQRRDHARACRSCGTVADTVMADLGQQPPSNAYLNSAAEIAGEARYPLRAVVCGSCKLVQLDHDVPPAELFKGYAYFSSFSDSWLEHARRYCEMAIQRFGLNRWSLVVELAS